MSTTGGATDTATAVELMFEGVVSEDAVALAVDDAKRYMKKHEIDETNDDFSLLLRYYACHLLYMWGLNQRVTAKSIDDISETRKDLELGDKEGVSPYLTEFRKLHCPDDFLTAI